MLPSCSNIAYYMGNGISTVGFPWSVCPSMGLLPSLQRHPTVFVVMYTGKTNRQENHRFEFRVAPPRGSLWRQPPTATTATTARGSRCIGSGSFERQPAISATNNTTAKDSK